MVHKQKHTEESKQKISERMKEVRDRMRDNDLKRLEELSPKYLQLKMLEFISEFIIERNKLILDRLKNECTNWFMEVIQEDIAADNTKCITIYEFQIFLDNKYKDGFKTKQT